MSRDELARTFRHAGVAGAYRHRPPYPDELFTVLTGLVRGPRRVLDLGAGEGSIARPLASMVDRVDAVDPSAAMVAAGRAMPGGDRPRWILGTAETCELDGPYGLATAGESLHWMDAGVVLPRLAGALAEGAVLVIVERREDAPWREPLTEVIRRHSRSTAFDPAFSLVDSLGPLFTRAGAVRTAAVPFEQSADGLVERLHSTSSLAREHMDAGEAAAFAASVAEAVRPWASGGVLRSSVAAAATWGYPGETTTAVP